MKVKTSELIGAVLDWAASAANKDSDMYPYSTSWQDGGPIIEREKIATVPLLECWEAQYENEQREDRNYIVFSGPTPLIAAMRCFVASRLGDEVDVPLELV